MLPTVTRTLRYLAGIEDPEPEPEEQQPLGFGQQVADWGQSAREAAGAAGAALGQGIRGAAETVGGYLPDLSAPTPAAPEPDQISRYVPSYAPQAAQVTAEDAPTSDWGGTADTIVDMGAAGLAGASEVAGDRGSLLIGGRPPETPMEVWEQAMPAPARAAQYVSDITRAAGKPALRTGAAALGYSADPTLGTEAFDTPAVGPIPSVHVPAFKFSEQDVAGEIGANLADPQTYLGVGAAGRAADLPVQAALGAARQGAGATVRGGTGLVRRGARWAAGQLGSVGDDAADALAAPGVQHLGSGVVPEGGGRVGRGGAPMGARQIEERAVQEFGIANAPEETGYILRDGRGLDFSGRKYGGETGMRERDHSEIASIVGDEEPVAAFMGQTGAIRVGLDDGILIAEIPSTVTPAQRRALAAAARKAESVSIDIVDAAANRHVSSHGFDLPMDRGKLNNFLANLPEAPRDDGVQHLGSGVVPEGLRADLYNCFDDQTEVLTDSGWVPFALLCPEDQVASYDPASQQIVYGQPLERQVYDFDGEMVAFQARGVFDALVTPNHRMYGQTDRRHPDKHSVADTTRELYHRVAADGHDREYDVADDELRAVAWVLTDGSINVTRRSWRVVVSQRASKAHLIREVLDRLGWEYSEGTRTPTTTQVCGRVLVKPPQAMVQIRLRKASRDALMRLLPSKQALPCWLSDLSRRQFLVFLNTWIDGDGHRHPKKPNAFQITGRPDLLEQLQILAVANGCRARFIPVPDRGYARLNVLIGRSRVRVKPHGISRVMYAGKVYCVTTPYETVVVRRNGCVAITGNSAQGGVMGAASEDLQAQQEGREPDPGERLIRGAIGAGLAVGGGRYVGRGASGARALGSGVVPASGADDVGRAARRARIAARGPLPELPEGAVPIRATPEQEVSRLRLDRFPEAVRADIQAAAEGTDFARTQRRGVLPDAAVSHLADEDARSVDDLIKRGKAGRAYNPEETVALRNAVASQADVVRSLSTEIAEATAGGATPELLIARRAAESTKLQGLVQVAEGARAEAGRTLRQYAQQARLIELDPNAAIARIRAKIADPDEFAAIVDEYTQAVNDGADPIVMAKLWAKVENGQIKAGDVFALYRRFNMLSGPRTLEVNALSGGMNLGYEVAGQALGQVGRGRLAEAAAEVAAPVKAAGRAFKNMAETMFHGVTAEQAARGDIPRNLSSRTDNPLAKAALTTMEIPDRLNTGVDQFFRTMTEDWAATIVAQRQARASGLHPRSNDWAETVTKNLEALRDDPSKFPEIQQLAERVTFSEEPGGIVKDLEGLKRNHPNTVGFLMPFIRTPANIASRAVDLSPFGIARTAVEAGTGLGRGRTQLGRRVRDNAVGTAATLWAYDQAQQGNITGAGPDDPEQRAELRATGWQPYSLKIGDQYWSYANFAPFSLALSAGAAASEAQKYAKPGKEDTLSMLSDGAARTGKVVTDMTVLAGLGAVMKSIDDPDRYGPQWLTTALTQLMPAGSFLNTVGQMTDPTVRRAERDTVGNQVMGGLAARVPDVLAPISPIGTRSGVPAAQDPLGRDIPSEQTGWRALNPFRPTTERDEPLLREFLAAGVDIGAPRRDLTISIYGPGGRVTESIPMPLTPAEQRDWNRLRGEALAGLVGNVATDPAWQAAPALDRERYLRARLGEANEYATRTVQGQIGDDEITRRIQSRRRAS